MIASLILDPNFGNKLQAVLKESYVWIISSPVNDIPIKECWEQIKLENDPRPDVLTSFKELSQLDPFDAFAQIVWDMDEHLNQNWKVFKVYGAPLSPRIEKFFLDKFDSHIVSTKDHGFVVSK